MTTLSYDELPFFEPFNVVAEDDRLFDRVLGGEALAELPNEDLFMVAHRMGRDSPYGKRGHYELTYVLSGHVIDVVEGQEVHLLADSLCLTTPQVSHGLRTVDEDAVVVVLCLRPTLFSSGVFAEYLAQDDPVSNVLRGNGAGYLVLSDTYGRILYRRIRELLKEYYHADGHATFSMLARTLLLLAQLSEIDTYSFYGLDQHLMEIVEYAREHCATVSVASLARRFGYSENYFSQLVRKRCGIGARELIIAARLRSARELLASTQLSVQDIAQSVGYQSYSHFNRIFRETYHITPAAYRTLATGRIAP